MTSVLTVSALLAAVLVGVTWGQDRMACPTLTSNECYYNGTGAAVTPVTQSDPSKYFIVGGFFDVHERGETAYTCSSDMSMEGILSFQAFLWGIREYSRSALARYGVSVGSVAFDSCGRPEQNIENMLSWAQCKLYLQTLPEAGLVGYVGPYTNDAVRAISSLATDLSLPLLAPVANAPDLMGDFLLQLSPRFSHMVDAIFSLLQTLEVDRVIVLYDPNDDLMVRAYNHLSRAINTDNRCTNYERAYVMSERDELMDRLEEESRDKQYVVPLMNREMLDHLMDGVKSKSSIAGNAFRFIISTIGRDQAFMIDKSASANNSLIIEASSSSGTPIAGLAAEVERFIRDLRDSTDGQLGVIDSPWITQYMRSNPKPVIDDTTPSRVRFMVSKTLAAVRGVIYGMSDAIESCGRNQICDNYRNLGTKGQNLFARFSQQVFGDDGGSMQNNYISYNVYHYFVTRDNPPVVRFEMAAEVEFDDQGSLQTTMTKELLDVSQFGPYFNEPECPGIGMCCLDPTTTPPAEVTMDPNNTPDQAPLGTDMSNMVNVSYPADQEITGAYFDAERRSGEYGTRFDLNHRWIIALGVLAGLGILSVVVFEIYILYKLLGTRLGNKWRTMWLGQLLLFGVLLCYLVLFAYLPIPTKATCGITRFGVGVAYSVCFAVLLVKLMVILTSRSSSDVLLPGDAESPNYLKGIYQFLMFIFAVGVQVVIDVQWLIIVPPDAVPVISNNGERVWVCNHYTWEASKGMGNMDDWVRSNFENHLMSLTYIMVMILITTILSLNAHGIITNHRESVFIGIAAGFSIPIWLAWGLVGGLNQDHDYAQEFGDACIAFGLFCTATLILFSMFLPKVRQLVNMGVEGIYLEDDRETYYAGSVIMAPPSYKGKGPNSVIYVNNQGIYSEPVVLGNGDPSKDSVANRLKHPGSTYSAPPVFAKKADSTYGGSRVLRVTDDLKGRHPQKAKSEAGTASRAGSRHGTLTRSRSQTSLGAL